MPPLWFQSGFVGVRNSSSSVAGSALFGSLDVTLNRESTEVCGESVVRVVDEEFAVLLVLRMERQAEQPFFVLAILVDDFLFDIQKLFRFVDFRIVGKHHDRAVLRNHRQPICAIGRIGNVDGTRNLKFRECPFDFHRQRIGADGIGLVLFCGSLCAKHASIANKATNGGNNSDEMTERHGERKGHGSSKIEEWQKAASRGCFWRPRGSPKHNRAERQIPCPLRIVRANLAPANVSWASMPSESKYIDTFWYRTFFRGLANDMWRQAVPPELTRKQAEFIAQHGAPPGGLVLDVPCGNGRIALELAETRVSSYRSRPIRGIDSRSPELRNPAGVCR